MTKTTIVLLSLVALAALAPTLVCGQDQSTPTATQAVDAQAQPPTPKSTKGVLVTINGTGIGEADVRFALKGGGHDTVFPPEHRKNVLEVIIRRELVYQRAVELGLDANAKYQEKLRQMEAQINAFKRRELSDLFFRKEIAGKAHPSQADAQKYFAENTARIRTELHVWQILLRKESSIQQALNDIEQGIPFEEVAGKPFAKLPKMNRAPWDLGYLRWKQIPKSWQDVVHDLKKGEVSGIIQGPNNRFWIIKLIDKRENPDITFESVKPIITEVLKNAKMEELREQADRDLRAKASIVYMKDSVAAPQE